MHLAEVLAAAIEGREPAPARGRRGRVPRRAVEHALETFPPRRV
jgi:hypothetical protein